MAPFSRSQATATDVSSPPEKAMPMRSPTGTDDRMAMGDDTKRDRGALAAVPSDELDLGQGRTSSTRLKGVSVARRQRLKPASPRISAHSVSPTWLPRPRRPSSASEAGRQMDAELA